MTCNSLLKDRTPATRGMSRGAGFTIIELLVVISIIALLIAILLPSLSKAKAQAATTQCAATLKGLDSGLLVYLAAWDNTVPANGILFPKCGGKNTAPTTGYDGLADANVQDWDLPYGVLWDYVNKNRAAYLCKEDVSEGLTRLGTQDAAGNETNYPLERTPNWSSPTGTISVAAGHNGYWSYSVNSILNSQGQLRSNFIPRGPAATTQQPWIDPLKWTTIRTQEEFFVFIEEDVNSPFNDEVFDPPAYNGGDKLTDRHQNGGNVAFADGHVDWFSDVLFNNGPTAGTPANQDNWAAMQYPISRNFFPDNGGFAADLSGP